MSRPEARATTEDVPGLSRPDTASGSLQRAILELLHEHRDRDELPTNGRFIYYELAQRGVVSKVRTGARQCGQNTIDAHFRLRVLGIVPWWWIEDETRTLDEWRSGSTIAECVLNGLDGARINPWREPPPLILVESRSLGGVLRRLAAEYVCPIAPTNGQVGGFLRTDILPLLEGNERRVLYLGDLDLQGGQIEANTRRVLERETGRTIDWTRLAITKEQVEERGLEPILKKDNRYRPPREQEAWETEALGQTAVMALVREALDGLLPEPLKRVLEREARQRRKVAGLLRGRPGKNIRPH